MGLLEAAGASEQAAGDDPFREFVSAGRAAARLLAPARRKALACRVDVHEPPCPAVRYRTETGPGGVGLLRPGRTYVRVAAVCWRSLDAPVVQQMRWVVLPERAPALLLTFSHEMNRKRVQDVRNYTLLGPDGRRIGLQSAVYGLAPQTLLLFPAQHLLSNRSYRLRINARGARGVTNAFGIRLDGRATGRAGADFVGVFSAQNRLRGVTAPRPLSVRVRARAPEEPDGARPPIAPAAAAVDEFLVAFEQALQENDDVAPAADNPQTEAPSHRR
jgi:hypothetical protein